MERVWLQQFTYSPCCLGQSTFRSSFPSCYSPSTSALPHPLTTPDPSGYWTLGEAAAVISILSILSFTFIPHIGFFTAGNTAPDEKVKVYFGYSPLYWTGHTAIEVNGKIYDYPGGAQEERWKGRDPAEYFLDQQTKHLYYTYYQYALNYNSQQVAKIASNTTSLLKPGGYFSNLNEDGNYPFGKHCVNFVKSSLVYFPNNDLRFLHAQWSLNSQFPAQYEGLISGLALISGGKTVSILPHVFG